MTNLELAQEALRYAQERIKESSSALKTPDTETLRINKNINHMRQSTLDKQNSIKALYRVASPHSLIVKSRSKIITQFEVGNCSEYATLALRYIHKQSSIYAETMYIQDGDHAFVVIGRPIDTDINKPETWGEDAVVCDPWSDMVYPASEIPEKLQCFSGTTGKRAVYPRDPSTHKLHNELIINRPEQTKQILITDAICKINLIKYVISCTADSEDSRGIIANIDEEIQRLQSADNHEVIDMNSHLLEKHLNKYIASLLKFLKSLCDSKEIFEQRLNQLLECWINTYLINRAYYADINILIFMNKDVVFAILNAMRANTNPMFLNDTFSSINMDMLPFLNEDVLLFLLDTIADVVEPYRLNLLASNISSFLHLLVANEDKCNKGGAVCFMKWISKLNKENVVDQYAKITCTIHLPDRTTIHGGLLHLFTHMKNDACFDALLPKITLEQIATFLLDSDSHTLESYTYYRDRILQQLDIFKPMTGHDDYRPHELASYARLIRYSWDLQFIHCLEVYAKNREALQDTYKGKLGIDSFFGGYSRDDKLLAAQTMIASIKVGDFSITAQWETLPKAAKQGRLGAIMKRYIDGGMPDQAWLASPESVASPGLKR